MIVNVYSKASRSIRRSPSDVWIVTAFLPSYNESRENNWNLSITAENRGRNNGVRENRKGGNFAIIMPNPRDGYYSTWARIQQYLLFYRVSEGARFSGNVDQYDSDWVAWFPSKGERSRRCQTSQTKNWIAFRKARRRSNNPCQFWSKHDTIDSYMSTIGFVLIYVKARACLSLIQPNSLLLLRRLLFDLHFFHG